MELLSEISGLLGYLMVLASFIMVLPQIYTILVQRRVDGLNLTSLIFDLVAAMMGFTINWSLSNPFRKEHLYNGFDYLQKKCFVINKNKTKGLTGFCFYYIV